MNERTRNAFCWVVALGWLGNLVAGMVPALSYEPSPLVTAPMMLVLGAVYSVGKRGKDDNR